MSDIKDPKGVNWFKYIGIMCFIAAVYFLYHQPPPVPKPVVETLSTPAPNPKPKPIDKPAAPPPKVVDKLVAKVEKQEPQQDPKVVYNQPQKWIDFKVVDNWAVMQSDILLGKVDKEVQTGKTIPRKTRIWPSSYIPFSVNEDVVNPERIIEVIEYFNSVSPVQFVPYKQGDVDSIVFMSAPELCASYVGRIGGHQPIFVSADCGFKEILHEMMHSLGFIHEQSRVDRNEFVEIIWENIKPGFEEQFAIVPNDLTDIYHGINFYFDYESVMLYPSDAFALDPSKKTLRSLTSREIKPLRDRLSKIDLERLDYLYAR